MIDKDYLHKLNDNLCNAMQRHQGLSEHECSCEVTHALLGITDWTDFMKPEKRVVAEALCGPNGFVVYKMLLARKGE